MDAARHTRIKETFLALQPLPPQEWNAALERLCGSDIDLRQDVESLLAHHQSESILAPKPALPPAERARVAQINFGQGASIEWDEQQRLLLHQRLQLWIIVLFLLIGFVLLRVFGLAGGSSTVDTSWMLVGLVGASLVFVFLSGRVLLLREPSHRQLRWFEVALTSTGMSVLFCWGLIWLTRGMKVAEQPSAQLDDIFRQVYWVVAADRSLYLQMPQSMIGSFVATLWSALAAFYAFIIPNTPRRGILMIVANVLLLLGMICLAALLNPDFRPHMLKNLVLALSFVGAFPSAAFYMSLQSASLRRAVFEAKQVGRYRLVRPLGTGAMGEVYLAQHHLLRRPCAVKLIRPERASSRDWIVRFEREVQAMAQLTHPNTVEVYDFGRTEDGSFFYAMEYLPGMTLDAAVRNHGPMPAGRVVYLCLQICGALAEAHHKGLVHRDIKTGNVFLSERGGAHDFIKLLDFGLVFSHYDEPALPPGQTLGEGAAHLTQTGQLMGTPTFMSPEQIRGEQLDARSDIYNLGGVMYFLLTGKPPFERDTLADLFDAHLHAPVPELGQANLPADLAAIIGRCLNKRREDRFQNVLEITAALRKTAAVADWDSARADRWWSDKR